MKRFKALVFILSLLVAGITFYSCDTLENDIIPQEEDILQFSDLERTIYIQPAGEGVINLSDKINTANTVKVTIDQAPVLGSLKLMKEGIYKFTAKASFISGSDKVIFTVMDNSKEVDRDTVNIVVLEDTVNVPCYTGANPDEFIISKENFVGETFIYDILINDKVCSNSFEVKQLKDALEGTSFIKDNKLHYTPANTSLTEKSDQVVYELCQTIDGEVVCSSALVAIKHKKMACNFSLSDDFLKVTYQANDTLFYLDVLGNDSICSQSSNPEYYVVDDNDLGTYFENGKILLPLQAGLVFPAVEDFHLLINYKVCVEGSGCQTATAKVYIKDCQFEAVDDVYQLEYLHNSPGDTSTFRLQVLENDIVCSDKKILAISSSPRTGAFATFEDDIIVFKHDKDIWGEFSFTYLLCDEKENCSEAKVTLNITPK